MTSTPVAASPNTLDRLLAAPRGGVAIFTACSANYLTKAMAMCLSVLAHEPDAVPVILLVDGRREVQMRDPRVRIVWADDLGFPDYLKCAFKYNIIELNTALKPFMALRLLETFDRVLYLDPDICVYAPLTPVHEALETHSTVLTPHALSPYTGAGRPTDQDLLRFGAANLGFFAVRADDRARALLEWWDRQCRSNCFYEPQSGLGVDQKWLDLAPSFFEGVHLLRDLGLNVAFWNLHERTLSREGGRWMVNASVPLRFIHFSSFVEGDEHAVANKQTRYPSGGRPDFAAAARTYRDYLQASRDSAVLAHTDYAYAHFANGAAISASLRRFYAISQHPVVVAAADPFASDAVYRYAQANRLLTRGTAVVGPHTFKAQSGYSRQQALIGRLFRAVLRLLGPDRYFLLLRYLGNYTSILNQSDIGRAFDSRFRP